MSSLTERDPDAPANAWGQRFTAALTLLDIAGACSVPAPTIRDAPHTASDFAVPHPAATLRDDNLSPVSDGNPAVPSGLLEKYEIIVALGEGAEAHLWRVRRRTDSREFALKLYHPGIEPDSAVLDWVQLNKPRHVPELLEHGREAGHYFEVIELINGASLPDLTCYGPLDEGNGSKLLRQAVASLEALHKPDSSFDFVIHRDVKPEHFLWCLNRNQWFLCDLGVALLENNSSSRTAAARPGGNTPRYAAPEALAGRAQTKSDYWSLGMTVLEARTGTHPLSRLTEEESRRRITSDWQFDPGSVNYGRWQELFAGLLRREAGGRWSGPDVHAWLDQGAGWGTESSTESADGTHSFSGQAAAAAGGASYDQYSLAVHLARHWEQSVRMLTDTGPDGDWLRQQLQSLNFDGFDHLLQENATSSDLCLLRLIYRLAPGLAPVWKEWSVDEYGMMLLCNNALLGDLAMQALVEEIFRQDVLKEIGANSTHASLGQRAAEWKQAYKEYSEAWENVREGGGSDSARPARGEALASLYRALVQGFVGGAVLKWAEVARVELCCPWAAQLLHSEMGQRVGYRLVANMTIPQCQDRFQEHLHLSHDFAPGTRVQGEATWTRGQNPPVISFWAVYTPVNFTICNQEVQVGNRIRLFWNVSGASWVYLKGFGIVPPEHAMEITVGDARQFTLRAFNIRNVSVCRLPLIPMNAPALLKQQRFTPQAKYALPPLTAADLPKQESLLPRVEYALPSLTAADLPKQQSLLSQAEYALPPLTAADLSPQAQWEQHEDGIN